MGTDSDEKALAFAGALSPRRAFEVADYLCSALSPLVKPSVRADLIALKFHLWDACEAASSQDPADDRNGQEEP